MEYALIGGKLGHSYSPAIHAQLGDYDYRLREQTVRAEQLLLPRSSTAMCSLSTGTRLLR